jgi:hypothetical protein
MISGAVNSKSVDVAGLILAIDLGKYKSVPCAYEPVETQWQRTSCTTNRSYSEVLWCHVIFRSEKT